MKTRLIGLAFLMLVLAACTPAVILSPTTTTTSIPISSTIALTATQRPLSPTPTQGLTLVVATPLPTQQLMFEITPDAIQVARWQEYQTELVNCFLSIGGCTYPYPFTEMALCEWDILGHSGQEVYIWAVCFAVNAAGEGPAVIHLEADGSIQKVEAPHYGPTAMTDIERLFPADIQAKIALYFQADNNTGPLLGKSQALGKHLFWRQDHREEPPLIILSATPQP